MKMPSQVNSSNIYIYDYWKYVLDMSSNFIEINFYRERFCWQFLKLEKRFLIVLFFFFSATRTEFSLSWIARNIKMLPMQWQNYETTFSLRFSIKIQDYSNSSSSAWKNGEEVWILQQILCKILTKYLHFVALRLSTSHVRHWNRCFDFSSTLSMTNLCIDELWTPSKLSS